MGTMGHLVVPADMGTGTEVTPNAVFRGIAKK